MRGRFFGSLRSSCSQRFGALQIFQAVTVLLSCGRYPRVQLGTRSTTGSSAPRTYSPFPCRSILLSALSVRFMSGLVDTMQFDRSLLISAERWWRPARSGDERQASRLTGSSPLLMRAHGGTKSAPVPKTQKSGLSRRAGCSASTPDSPVSTSVGGGSDGVPPVVRVPALVACVQQCLVVPLGDRLTDTSCNPFPMVDVEVPLARGDASAGVMRVGDTVRKPPLPSTLSVARFTAHLRSRGNDVPAAHGRDRDGAAALRDLPADLSFIPPTAWAFGTRQRTLQNDRDTTSASPLSAGTDATLCVDAHIRRRVGIPTRWSSRRGPLYACPPAVIVRRRSDPGGASR